MGMVMALVLAGAALVAACGTSSNTAPAPPTNGPAGGPAPASEPGTSTGTPAEQGQADRGSGLSAAATHDTRQRQATVEEAASRQGVTKARVVRVVDGDTLEVERLAGAPLPATRVRMIGVNTPEVHGREEPYGPEASSFTRRRLAGRTVWLEKDVSETDRYGRALRYVWLVEPPADPTERQIREGMFNAILVLQGYAQVATYPPDVRYADLFVKFQREAREAGRGLWGAAVAGSAGSSRSGRSSGSPGSSSGAAGRSLQSASRSSPGGKKCDPAYPGVCIPPPPPDLDCGDIPHRNIRVLPPDPHRLDGRDKDGIGCES